MSNAKAKSRNRTAAKRAVHRRLDEGRAVAARRFATRADGFVNQITGHGTSRDRRLGTRFECDPVTDLEGIELWRGNAIAARIVEKKTTEALRRGIDIVMPDREVSAKLERMAERVHLLERVKHAGHVENACGGAAIFPVFEGVEATDFANPLDENRIGRMTAMHVLEPRELYPLTYYRTLLDDKFRRPETYRLMPLNSNGMSAMGAYQGVVIHESRLVLFYGRQVTSQVSRYQRPGWGDSELTLPRETMNDYGLSWAGTALLLSEFGRKILRMAGFAEMSDQGKDTEIDNRITNMATSMSTLNMTVVDKDDEIVQVQTPVTGLSDLLIQLAQRLAADADMPLTILMGMSPAGLNATGDMDIRAWYDRIAARAEYYRPMIMRLIKLLMLDHASPAHGVDDEEWSIQFRPLWQPTGKEQAEERKLVAETDAIQIEKGIVTPTQVRDSRWKGGAYSPDMSIDFDEVDKQAEADVVKFGDMTPEDIAAMNGGKTPDAIAAVAATAANVPDHGSSKIAATGSAPAQNAALNGAQVLALVNLISSVATRAISRESGIATIMLAYNVNAERAAEILGPADFVPAAPVAAPANDVAPPDAPPAPDAMPKAA